MNILLNTTNSSFVTIENNDDQTEYDTNFILTQLDAAKKESGFVFVRYKNRRHKFVLMLNCNEGEWFG